MNTNNNPSVSVVGGLMAKIKEHYKMTLVVSLVLGAILVIYYCATIRQYPSGLTASDTLFFVWVIAVFGFYYSIVAFIFFLSSLFWLSILGKPINWLLKFSGKKDVVYLPTIKTDIIFTFGGGFAANLILFGTAIYNSHPILNIVAALCLIIFMYALVDELSRKPSISGSVVDSKGHTFTRQPVSPAIVRFELKGSEPFNMSRPCDIFLSITLSEIEYAKKTSLFSA